MEKEVKMFLYEAGSGGIMQVLTDADVSQTGKQKNPE